MLAALRLTEEVDERQFDAVIDACVRQREETSLVAHFQTAQLAIGAAQRLDRISAVEKKIASLQQKAAAEGIVVESAGFVASLRKFRQQLAEEEASAPTPTPCPNLQRLLEIVDASGSNVSATDTISLNCWAATEWRRVHMDNGLREPTSDQMAAMFLGQWPEIHEEFALQWSAMEPIPKGDIIQWFKGQRSHEVVDGRAFWLKYAAACGYFGTSGDGCDVLPYDSNRFHIDHIILRSTARWHQSDEAFLTHLDHPENYAVHWREVNMAGAMKVASEDGVGVIKRLIHGYHACRVVQQSCATRCENYALNRQALQRVMQHPVVAQAVESVGETEALIQHLTPYETTSPHLVTKTWQSGIRLVPRDRRETDKARQQREACEQKKRKQEEREAKKRKRAMEEAGANGATSSTLATMDPGDNAVSGDGVAVLDAMSGVRYWRKGAAWVAVGESDRRHWKRACIVLGCATRADWSGGIGRCCRHTRALNAQSDSEPSGEEDNALDGDGVNKEDAPVGVRYMRRGKPNVVTGATGKRRWRAACCVARCASHARGDGMCAAHATKFATGIVPDEASAVAVPGTDAVSVGGLVEGQEDM